MGRTTARALAALALATLAVGAATTGVALAAPAAPARSAAPAVPVANALHGIWCASLKSCLAVGSDTNQPAPLAETWNGSAWKAVRVKLPAKVSRGQLWQVSCLSAKDCVAVGFYVTGDDIPGAGVQHALADTWTGSGWTVAAPPAPAGLVTGLTGVSCPKAGHCVAVGGYTVNNTVGPTSVPLADVLTGKTWTRRAVPVPKGVVFSALDAVSCPSAGFCAAVGSASSEATGSALIDVWNGKAWSSVKPAALPAGVGDASLSGVSCVSAKSCVAVGFGNDSAGLITISETWNGKAWSYAKVSWPKGVNDSELWDVSCQSASRCVAAGDTGQNPNVEGFTSRAASLLWNGKAWSALSVPAPAKGKYSRFTAVMCQKSFCAAAGQTGPTVSTNGTGLAGFWTGSRWKLVAAK
jgi:hypothetical protein